MTPVVALTDVRKTFSRGDAEIVVLDGLDAAVMPGEVVIVRGRSGSGKTTLLNILAGWQEPDSGSVTWGVDHPGSWDQVAIVPQSLGLLAELTLGENIGLPGRLADVPSDVTSSVEKLEISHLVDRGTSSASLGEQQRAAIARALIRRPALLLADEPSSHQDLGRLHLVWRLISEVAASGTAVIAATHDPDAFEYADRVLDLRNGRLIEARRAGSGQRFEPPSGGSRMNDTQLQDFASRYTTAWNSHDPEAVASFFAEDGSLAVNGGEPEVGRDAIASVARGFFDTFPDTRLTMDLARVAGEVAVYLWTYEGTDSGPGGGGRRVRFSGWESWTFSRDGLVEKSIGSFDVEEYQRQLTEGV
jgi:putative ABC transport system ATP-binding protein